MEVRFKKSGSMPSWEMLSKIRPLLGIYFFAFIKELEEFGVDWVEITSIIRPKTTDTGLHELGRAIDISTKNIPKAIGKICMDKINNKYTYDMSRPKLEIIVFHQDDSAFDDGLHFHLQCRAY